LTDGLLYAAQVEKLAAKLMYENANHVYKVCKAGQ
jgi:hypothetical protein